MNNFKIHLKNAMIAALGFGIGFLLGSLLAHWLLNSAIAKTLTIPLDFLPVREAVRRGLTFLIQVIFSVAVGGAMSGAIGGLSLSFCFSTLSAKKRWFIWRGALSFALVYAILVVPVVIVISVIVYYRASYLDLGDFVGMFGFTGLVLGAASGLLLGALTVGRRYFWRVMLAAGVGFGMGGIAFGFGMWQLFRLNTGSLFSPQGSAFMWIFLFIFGALGGAGLGFGYTVIATQMAVDAEKTTPPKKPRPRWLHFSLVAVAVIAGIYGVLLVRSVIVMITPQEAQIARIVPAQSVGTHWKQPTPILETTDEAKQPVVFVSRTGQPHITWAQDTGQTDDIFYIVQITGENENKPGWTTPINVSNSPAQASGRPAAVVDRSGRSHIVWTEQASTNTADVFYSNCIEQYCTPPIRLSSPSNPACAAGAANNAAAVIAIDETDTPMVTWVADQNTLIYSSWPADQNPPASPNGCIPTADSLPAQPQVAGGSAGHFALVIATGAPGQTGPIVTSHYSDQGWDATPELIGQGYSPSIMADQRNETHLAWCGPDNVLQYWTAGGQVESIAFPRCLDRPGLAEDSAGRLHLVWYSDQVRNAAGGESSSQLLYESMRDDTGWSEPAIVSQTGAQSQPSLTFDEAGTLYLVWDDTLAGQQTINYSTQTQYECTDVVDISYVSRAVLDVAMDPKFHHPGAIVPFCQNQYEELVYTPNPRPEYSDQIATENGGFEKFAEFAQTVRYEILFSTMWYDADVAENSPGFVLAEAIAELYQKLKDNPSQYPKGLTVRILLDNPQKVAPFIWDTQLWSVVEDLRQAGVPEMVNPELGWKLEVANYDGAYPHGHAKVMVVDGKEAIAVGFNMQYDHFPVSNPSGLGNGRVDFGLHAKGPVVQATQASFDDLWTGSHQWHCPDIGPSAGLLWFTACSERQATGEHVPEVLRYDLPDVENGPAFSMYRTEKYQMSDNAIVAAIESAKNNIHITQVEFTADFICDFTPLYNDVCTFEKNALPFMKAILKAIETNGVQVNLIGVQTGVDGYETHFGLNLLQNELAKRGLSDHFTVRFTTEPWHGKTILIDDQFVIVGSQNFQYAAWGEGQAEYNFGVQNPRAVEDYVKAFQYHWEKAVPQQLD